MVLVYVWNTVRAPVTIRCMIWSMPADVLTGLPPFVLTSTKASLYVVAGAAPFSSPLCTIKSIGPDPLLLSTSNHFTAGHGSSKPQRDMSVKKRGEKRGDLWRYSVSCLLISFPGGGEEERVVVNVTRELSGPLLSDPLSFPWLQIR